jgi:hypothetical protein
VVGRWARWLCSLGKGRAAAQDRGERCRAGKGRRRTYPCTRNCERAKGWPLVVVLPQPQQQLATCSMQNAAGSLPFSVCRFLARQTLPTHSSQPQRRWRRRLRVRVRVVVLLLLFLPQGGKMLACRIMLACWLPQRRCQYGGGGGVATRRPVEPKARGRQHKCD